MVIPNGDCRRHSCHRSHHHDSRLRHRDRTFDHLAKQVINLDKKSKELCVENSNDKTVEDYSENDYKITVNLVDYEEENITVKTKYRALYINAEKDDDVYFEVRIVPEVANIYNATWDYSDDKLEITFPYKEREEYSSETCTLVIDETVNIVQKYSPNLDVRMRPGKKSVNDQNEDDKVNNVKN
ncbi:uncharacterized protein LOC128678222 [Plodia interpunctella]|uniref:uncharacterized protein LOC128678222 n=1 Tax=Plodia interpunctella TaxID=58824 RepID=UPI0031015CEC